MGRRTMVDRSDGTVGADPFRASWLLDRMQIHRLDADDVEHRIGVLKRAHADGISVAGFADIWLHAMREEIRARLEGTGFLPGLAASGSGKGDDPARRADLRDVAARFAALAGVDPEMRAAATVHAFLRPHVLEMAWLGMTPEENERSRREVVAEVGRLRSLPESATLLDLAEAIAEEGDVDIEEVDPADPLYDEDVERFAARWRRPTGEEVGTEFGRFMAMMHAIADETARPPEMRKPAELRDLRKWRDRAVERLCDVMGDYFMADVEHPGYVPADDPGRMTLLGLLGELDAIAEHAIRTWNGASADEVAWPLRLLHSIALFTDRELDVSRFEGRLMIGIEAVDGIVVDDEPELLFQDIDGNIAMVMDGVVVAMDFPWDGDENDSDEDEDEEDERHPLNVRDDRWAKITLEAYPALSAFVRKYGGAEFWRGSEEDLCRRAVPELAVLADESELFGEHARIAFSLLLDTWAGQQSASGRRRH